MPARHGQFLEQGTELHDKRDLAGGKVLADAERRDQRERDEHVGLDVERRHKADDGLQNDGDAAENDRDPRRVERQGEKIENADDQRDAGDHKQCDVLFRAAQR